MAEWRMAHGVACIAIAGALLLSACDAVRQTPKSPQPTSTQSVAFRAAQAVCADATDLNGTAEITDVHGAPIETVGFHQSFLIHAHFTYPLIYPFSDSQLGGALLISRIDNTDTPQDIQMQNFTLASAGSRDVTLPFELPATQADTFVGSPSTTPGLYCISIQASYATTANGTESAAVLFAVR